MREQEVRNLWEAYLEVCENQQLDEVSDELVGRAVNARIARSGAANDAEMRDRTPENMRASVRAGEKEASMKTAAAKRRKRINKEEVETWVNSLIEEGYDLSDYTWEEMYDAYANLNEARTDPRGRPASGPMSVYGGRGTPSPDPEGDDNVSKMDRAQRRVKGTQPRAKGMAADSLFTKYSARQNGMEHGGEEGPGPNAPRRSGRPGRGANTDRGSGNAAKRRMSEDFDLFDTILEHLVAEGYADTNEAALVIMANMSEEWRQDIMEKEDSEYEKASDAALDKRYGYGRASGDKRSFGRAANRSSAAAALRAIRRGERSGSGTSREAGADAVHQGWATTAKTSADQTPEKKERRAKLANTSYSNLPDDEKEKDRVSFDAVRATYNKNKK